MISEDFKADLPKVGRCWHHGRVGAHSRFLPPSRRSDFGRPIAPDRHVFEGESVTACGVPGSCCRIPFSTTPRSITASARYHLGLGPVPGPFTKESER